MSSVEKWSQVAGENSDAAPDGSPEGHARTLVNDIDREGKSAVRRQWETMAWFDKTLGPTGLGFTLTKLTDSSVNLVHESTPTDASAKFLVGARVRVGNGSTYVYGYIVSAIYGAPNTVVTLDLDGASVVQATPTILELNVTDGTVGASAFSPIGIVLAQDPPEIPSIDLLGDGVTKDEGPGNLFDADTVDGFHAADLISAAAVSTGIGLINGNFEIGQRGHALTPTTSFPTDNAAYVADGWVLLQGNLAAHPAPGAGVVAVDLILSGASAAKADTRAIRLTGNANLGVAPVEKVGLIQWLPNDAIDNIEGSKVSLSVWAKRPVGTSIDNIRIGLVAWSGAVDGMAVDPINSWSVSGTLPTMLASYTLFASTTLLPTSDWSEHVLENITLPVGTNNLGILIWIDDTAWVATDEIEITGVRLVKGATAQSYEHEDYAANLQRCQRFFNSTFDEGATPRTLGSDEASALRTLCVNSDRGLLSWEFGTSMFKTPSVTRYNPGPSGTTNVPWNVTRSLVTGVITTYLGKRRAQWFIGQATDNPEDEYVMHATADASL